MTTLDKHENEAELQGAGASIGAERERMPPKAPGTYGVPAYFMEDSLCRFPLWADGEKPTPLSLYCGEPAEEGKPYCDFHADVHLARLVTLG